MTTIDQLRQLIRERAVRDVARHIFLDMGVAGPTAAVSLTADRIRALVESEVRAERERCAQVCRERADLWRTATVPGTRGLEENRARANEAMYLADLLITGDVLRPNEPR